MSPTAAYFQIPDPRPKAVRRFFAFHHAGGAAANYLKLKTALPPEYELILAELPGRGRLAQIAPFTEWSALTRTLSEAVAPLHDRPSIFFGHSLGGLVAYELLAGKIPSSTPPTLLAVSAINAPSHLIRSPFEGNQPPSDADLVARIRATGGAPREILDVPGLIEWDPLESTCRHASLSIL